MPPETPRPTKATADLLVLVDGRRGAVDSAGDHFLQRPAGGLRRSFDLRQAALQKLTGALRRDGHELKRIVRPHDCLDLVRHFLLLLKRSHDRLEPGTPARPSR